MQKDQAMNSSISFFEPHSIHSTLRPSKITLKFDPGREREAFGHEDVVVGDELVRKLVAAKAGNEKVDDRLINVFTEILDKIKRYVQQTDDS